MLPALLAREVALRSLPSPHGFLVRVASRPFVLSNHRLFQPTASPLWTLQLDVAFNRYLLGGGVGGCVEIYDTAEGPDFSVMRSPVLKARHGEGDVVVRTAGWHAEDCGVFVTGGTDGNVLLWDAENARVATKLHVRGAVSGACFAGSAALIAVAFAAPHASQPPQLRLWDVRQGGIAAHTFVLPAQPTALLAPAHAPFLVAGTALGHLLSLDPRSPLPIAPFSDQSPDSGPAQAHEKAITSLAATPDARFIVSAASDRTVRLWSSPPLCQLQRVVYDNAAAPIAVAAGPVLIAASGSALLQCDLHTGRMLSRMPGHLGAVQCVAAHRHEPLAFSAASDGTLLTWHPASANRHYLPVRGGD